MPAAGAPLEVDVEVRHLGQVLRDLKAFEPRLATALRREIRNAAKVAAGAAQAEVRKPPPARIVAATRTTARRTSPSGARERAARGIRVQIVTGARTNGVRIVQSERGFAKAYNTRRFRHPVFGGDTWVAQQGRPYFGAVIAAHRGDVEKAVTKAVDEAAATLAKRY